HRAPLDARAGGGDRHRGDPRRLGPDGGARADRPAADGGGPGGRRRGVVRAGPRRGPGRATGGGAHLRASGMAHALRLPGAGVVRARAARGRLPMSRFRFAAAVVAATLLAPAGAEAADWGALLERYAPAVVNLKISLKTEAENGGEPEESTEEVQGVVVDPGGLILVWNSHFSPNRFLEVFAHMGGGDFRM